MNVNLYTAYVFVDNGDANIMVQIDDIVLQFTPNDLYNFPVNASDFTQIPEGIPVLVYSNGTDKYIIALSWNGEVGVFNLILSSPSSKSINASYSITYTEVEL